MDIYQACEILNDFKHNDVHDYQVIEYGDCKIIDGEIGSYRYTEFEAIAIAERYLRVK
jgi:hypothetical protein